MTPKWTPEREAQLRELYMSKDDNGKTLSGAEIARRIGGGLTRNAIIGKAHRMGLTEESAAKAREENQRRWQAWIEREKAAEQRAIKLARAKSEAERNKSPTMCVTPGCRGTKQPGRHHCAECISAAYVKAKAAG